MFLKNKNIIFKIRRSKVTDYAALILYSVLEGHIHNCLLLKIFVVTSTSETFC